MPAPSESDEARLLQRARDGDAEAMGRLLTMVRPELELFLRLHGARRYPTRESVADVVVQEGMVFSFEPGARQGPMAEAKVGATAIVTADGLNVINEIGTRVQQV